jgi:hypothetical protein
VQSDVQRLEVVVAAENAQVFKLNGSAIEVRAIVGGFEVMAMYRQYISRERLEQICVDGMKNGKSKRRR